MFNLLLTSRPVQIGMLVFLIGLAWFLDRSHQYDKGRQEESIEWQLKIATAPAVVVHDTLPPVLIPQPIQRGTARAVHDTLRVGDSTKCCQDYTIIVSDSTGFSGEFTAHPLFRNLDYNYQLPPKVIQPIETIRTKDVLVYDHPTWWLNMQGLYGKQVGFGGSIGYKYIGLGYLRLEDQNVWQFLVHINL